MFILSVLLNSVFALTQDASTPMSGSSPTRARHILGMSEFKRNVNGELTISPDGLAFSSGGKKVQIPLASIEYVITGQDTRQTGGKAMTVTKMAAPYGGGRLMSLFTQGKFDFLTIEFRDSYGGLHAAILALPSGQGSAAVRQLVAIGAKTTTPLVDSLSDAGSNNNIKERE